MWTRCRLWVSVVDSHKLNLLAGWFPLSRLPRASWWLAPSSATAGGPKPRRDRPALWLTGLHHSSIGPLARGTCCPEALMEVRTQAISLSTRRLTYVSWITLWDNNLAPAHQVLKMDWWMAMYVWKHAFPLSHSVNISTLGLTEFVLWPWGECLPNLCSVYAVSAWNSLAKTEMTAVFNLWFHVRAQPHKICGPVAHCAVNYVM